jgi:hypothetical protein
MPSRATAIELLERANQTEAAKHIRSWTNKDGGRGGWDANFRAQFPAQARQLWPSGHGPVHTRNGVSERVRSPASADDSSDGTTAAVIFRECKPLLVPAARFENVPSVIEHADWSGTANEKERARKRQACRAILRNGTYEVEAPRQIENVDAWCKGLLRAAQLGEALLVGFDFPIGIPAAYASVVRCSSFRTFLGNLPREFLEIAKHFEEVSPNRPFFPSSEQAWKTVPAGRGSKLQAVAHRIGVADFDDLLRRCERKGGGRTAAQPLFLTSGARQVGRAALRGWVEVLGPLLSQQEVRVRVWPFDDDRLENLCVPHSITIVETYPTETYGHLGIGNRGKLHQCWRIDAIARALKVAGGAAPIVAARELAQRSVEGFGPTEDGEDPFDAVVGALGLALAVLGADSAELPDDDAAARTVEGWIVGAR